MSTKEQELKALEKIRKIVEDLGEESYIGTAFEGCFEIAEENIENDFACSMKNRWETERKDAEHFRRLAGKLTDELEKAKNIVETSTQDWAVASETYWFAWATMRLLVCCMKVDSVTTTAMNTRTKAAMESQYFFPRLPQRPLSSRHR